MELADSYSRGVEYSVNEETMEVSQVWAYGPEDQSFYARYLGDIDWQPKTDNILITIGGQETDAEGNNALFVDRDCNVQPGLVEVTHEQPAKIVWDLRLQDAGLGWSIYRGERLPPLYSER